jgi:hypothetical protein
VDKLTLHYPEEVVYKRHTLYDYILCEMPRIGKTIEQESMSVVV